MSFDDWVDDGLLGKAFPLPLDAPFTTAMALDAGISLDRLRRLARAGLLRSVVYGVYAATQAPDSVRFRCEALALVLDPDAVVTDRAAGWLHGMPVLRRGAHLEAPSIEVCHRSDTRSRRPQVDGHRRCLADDDIVVIHGVRATTPLRTACDLGRLLWRFDAFAALDAALRLGVDAEQLLDEIRRFKGFRGVRQLRALAPLADGRAESPGESALRLHWLEAGLPKPDLQLWIEDDTGVGIYRLDVPSAEVRYAAEYDGEDFHNSPDQREYDEQRRSWIRDNRGWTIDAFGKNDVYAAGTRIGERLASRFAECRRRLTVWTP